MKRTIKINFTYLMVLILGVTMFYLGKPKEIPVTNKTTAPVKSDTVHLVTPNVHVAKYSLNY